MSAVKNIQQNHIIGQWIGEDSLGEEVFFTFDENREVIAGYTASDDKTWQGTYRLNSIGKLIHLHVNEVEWMNSLDAETKGSLSSLSYFLRFVDEEKMYIQSAVKENEQPKDINTDEAILLVKNR